MRRQIKACLRPLVAALGLLGYLGSATPLVPLGIAAVAWLDGEHRVTVAAEKEGMTIVLRHDARSARTALTHVHCLASRAITLLAEPAGPVHADHVIHSHSGGGTALREAPPRVLAPLVAAPAAPAFANAFFLPAPVTSAEASLLPIPPPALSVLVVRATVFLI